MAAVYLAAVLLIFGLVQGDPIQRNDGQAFIEDMRNAGGSRIVAGWEAQEGQIPHQISLRMVNAAGGVSSCGGSIIHHEWVITAAHCVANRINFVIRLGLTNLTRPEFIVETTQKYIHPEYDELRAGVQTDDIALLGLEKSIPYGPNVQPCRLQNSGQKNLDYRGVVFTVSGFGRTDDLINGGAASEILLWVHLRGITNDECRWWYNNSPVVQDQTICAEYYNDTAQSSCQVLVTISRINFVIRLGLTNLTRPEFIVETTQKYIHPEYDELRAGVQTDDIALLGLEQSIPYGPNVQPCRLQNSGQKNLDYRGVVFTVSGFGRTDDLINGGAASEILLWVHLRGITNDECRWWYNNSPVVQDQTICAEYYNDTAQSSCQGDSGGPLTVVDADGAPTMVGIVSFGSAAGCNSPFPSAYVRPGHYHDWFYEVTGINFDWSSKDLEESLKPIQLPVDTGVRV